MEERLQSTQFASAHCVALSRLLSAYACVAPSNQVTRSSLEVQTRSCAREKDTFSLYFTKCIYFGPTFLNRVTRVIPGPDHNSIMSRLLGLRQKPRCFYCQHVLDTAPADPYNFECPSCASTNHFDPKTGEIASSEPAMYDTMANSQSFSRRGESSAVWNEMTTAQRTQRHQAKMQSVIMSSKAYFAENAP
jgi:phage FluMu protein Com